LVVNESEAETVRTLFRLYRELGTVRQLAAAAPRLRLMTKQRRRSSGQVTGGQPFTRGHLYQLLSNPIYVGEVAHKGMRHAGRHEAILDRETFEAIQRQLKDKAAARRSATNDKTPHPRPGDLRGHPAPAEGQGGRPAVGDQRQDAESLDRPDL
jgi:hypothetical protein